MDKEAKDKIVSSIKSIAAVITAITVIQGFLLWLFMPHIDDYVENKIQANQSSKEFETRIFDIADKYMDSPNFKLTVVHIQQEFREHLEERLKTERE